MTAHRKVKLNNGWQNNRKQYNISQNQINSTNTTYIDTNTTYDNIAYYNTSQNDIKQYVLIQKT